MRKSYAFVLFFAAFAFAKPAMADTYKVDFESTANTEDHAFRVAPGWSHIVDGYENPFFSWMSEYVEYSYEAGAGVDGSTALKVGSQNLSYVERYDLLVSPAVSGEVSIMVRSAAEPYDEENDRSGEDPQVPSVKFFVVSNGERDEEIVPAEAPEIGVDGFVKFVLPAQEGTQIGIRGEYVYLDNFEADGIGEVELSRGLKVMGGQLAEDNKTEIDDSQFWSVKTYVLANADGDFTLSYDVELNNSGELTLTPGDEGYTLSFYDQESGEVLAENVPVNVTLEPGETKLANVKLALNANGLDTPFYMTIRENVTGTQMGNYDFQVYVKIVNDDTTGISMANSAADSGKAVYTIGGRQSVNAQKGLVIRNGKKFNLK